MLLNDLCMGNVVYYRPTYPAEKSENKKWTTPTLKNEVVLKWR